MRRRCKSHIPCRGWKREDGICVEIEGEGFDVEFEEGEAVVILDEESYQACWSRYRGVRCTRMGQYWKIVNVDRRCEVKNDDGLKLLEILWNRVGEQLLDLLIKPSIPDVKVSEVGLAVARARQTNNSLVRLPPELVHTIAGVLKNKVDLICFAMSCSYLWRLLLEEVRHVLLADRGGSWAGDRLVLVGDYASGVPESCRDIRAPSPDYDTESDDEDEEQQSVNYNPLYALTKERRESGLGTVQFMVRRRIFTKDFGLEDPNQPHWCLHEYRNGDICNMYFSSHKLFERHIQEHGMDDGGYKLRQNPGVDLFDRLTKVFVTTNGETATSPGILRNLTTQQYVRDTVLAESDHAYSLGEVICAYTQWTEEGMVGEWAGHRFDIVAVHQVDESWTDVSDQALSRLEDVIDEQRSNGKRAWVQC